MFIEVVDTFSRRGCRVRRELSSNLCELCVLCVITQFGESITAQKTVNYFYTLDELVG